MLPRLNSNFNAQNFLEKHWSKSPAFLPKLISIEDPISPEELAGLACEEFIESRLVTNYDQRSLTHGPFSEEQFTSLPDNNWTLLVQSVDLYKDEIKALKSLFQFLPNWLLDDVMVSYAVPGGGVGPHFDHYDVFLIQGEGSRLWRVGEKCDPTTRIDTSSGLSLLQDTKLAKEFLLEQGDVLYLPAHYAHWGEANTKSICYSIGFRGPSQSEMIEGLGAAISQKMSPFDRFINNPEGHVTENPAKISNESLLSAYQITQSKLDNYEEFCRWFGASMTASRNPDLFEERDVTRTFLQIKSRVTDGADIGFNPVSRRAYCELVDSDWVLVFVDGEAYKLPREHLSLISEFCSTSACLTNIINAINEKGFATMIVALVKKGSIQVLTG